MCDCVSSGDTLETHYASCQGDGMMRRIETAALLKTYVPLRHEIVCP